MGFNAIQVIIQLAVKTAYAHALETSSFPSKVHLENKGVKSSPKFLTALTLSFYLLTHLYYKANCEQAGTNYLRAQ